MWYFLSQKVDGKIIFTDYWKVFVLNFSVMGNTVFFESRSWWKRWTCFELFVDGNTIFFWVKKLMEDDIYRLPRSFCFELFGDGKYDCFFQPKNWWKDDIYLVFLSFPWYFRTSDIRFFVQWNKTEINDVFIDKASHIYIGMLMYNLIE